IWPAGTCPAAFMQDCMPTKMATDITFRAMPFSGRRGSVAVSEAATIPVYPAQAEPPEGGMNLAADWLLTSPSAPPEWPARLALAWPAFRYARCHRHGKGRR